MGSAMPCGGWNQPSPAHVWPLLTEPHCSPLLEKPGCLQQIQFVSQFEIEIFLMKALSPLVLLLLSTNKVEKLLSPPILFLRS